MKDKRQFDRLKSYCLVRYNKITDLDNLSGKTTNIKNISEGGILFTSYEPLPVSSILKLTINLPGRRGPFETYAKVIRCIKSSETEEVYHIAISYLDIADKDKKEIHSHIDIAARDRRGKKLIEKPVWWHKLLFWRKKKKKSKLIPGTNNAFFSTTDHDSEKKRANKNKS